VWVKLAHFGTSYNNLISASVATATGSNSMSASLTGYFGEIGGGTTFLVLPNNTAIELNKWTHVVVTFGSGTYTLYENGVYVSSGQAPNYVDDGIHNAAFQVGAFGGAYGLDGVLWKPAYYEITLSTQQVRSVYNSQCVLIAGCVQVF
jgi:hypothetical protein